MNNSNPIVITKKSGSVTYLKDMVIGDKYSKLSAKGEVVIVMSSADLVELSTAQLLAVYNRYAETPTKRFATRANGEKRVWAQLEERRPVIRSTESAPVKEAPKKKAAKVAAPKILKADVLIERTGETPFKENSEPFAIMELVGQDEQVRYEDLLERGANTFKPKRSEKFNEDPKKFIRDYVSYCIKVGALRRVE